MPAVAVFTCHPSSHPFQTRRVDLSEPVKIGRSVAKARPVPDNAIFDCKVLSRNHALLYYDKETGKFCLQDTKSSNGTFVNNERLTRGSGENPEKEVRSGDIVQFGVDVVDTSKRVVVTHGRIVAQLTLYNPDGSEAVRSTPIPSVPADDSSSGVGNNNNVVSQQLFQLSCWLKEALYREQMLEQKLSTLQSLVSSTQDASESSWQALIDEDRLVSRLEVLENQLRAYSKANSEESIRVELAQLQEDKHMYETTAKESLKKALEEKLEASQNYADMERMLNNSKEECAHLNQELDNLNNEQRTLLEKHSKSIEEVSKLTNTISDLEKKHLEEFDQMNEEKNVLEERYEQMKKLEEELRARIKELEAANSTKTKNLSAVPPGLRKDKSSSLAFSGGTIKPSSTFTSPSSIIGEISMEAERRDQGDGAEITDPQLTSNGDEANITVSEDGRLGLDGEDTADKGTDSDASTPESEVPPSEEALERLKAQVKEIEEKLKASEERADRAEEEVMQASMETVQYEAKIQDLEMQLSELEENKDQSESVTSDTTSSSSSSIAKSSSKENGVKETTVPSELTVIQNHVDKEYIARLEQKHCEQLEHGYKEIESLKKDIVELKEIQKRLQDEKNLIDKNLENSQAENHRLQVETKQLKEQIGKSITSAKEAKKEIMELRDQLKLEKQACKTKDSAVQHAEELLTREKKVSQERKKKLEELEKTQAKSQKTTKNNEKELEKLKEQNSKLQKELEREKFLRTEVEKKVKRPAMFTRNEANIRKGQKKETDTEKTPKRIAEIEPVIAVKEGQIFQQRIPVTNTSKLSTNHLSEKQDSSSDAIALQKKELNGSRELSRLTDDLVRLRDRLHDTETKVSASPDGRQQVARLKTELSKSQEDIEKLISSCKKYEEEREAFQRELGRLHEVDSASMIGGISINQPYVVIAIAITAALAQIILAIWTAE